MKHTQEIVYTCNVFQLSLNFTSRIEKILLMSPLYRQYKIRKKKVGPPLTPIVSSRPDSRDLVPWPQVPCVLRVHFPK